MTPNLIIYNNVFFDRTSIQDALEACYALLATSAVAPKISVIKRQPVTSKEWDGYMDSIFDLTVTRYHPVSFSSFLEHYERQRAGVSCVFYLEEMSHEVDVRVVQIPKDFMFHEVVFLAVYHQETVTSLERFLPEWARSFYMLKDGKSIFPD